jgi:predicted 3-demethylubiquinone-9 3-methyltransferase (glyoxalase superfamily)
MRAQANGGPAFKHNEAFSFELTTDDQQETHRYWNDSCMEIAVQGIWIEAGWAVISRACMAILL